MGSCAEGSTHGHGRCATAAGRRALVAPLSSAGFGIALFVITLTINLISGWILRRYREVYQ